MCAACLAAQAAPLCLTLHAMVDHAHVLAPASPANAHNCADLKTTATECARSSSLRQELQPFSERTYICATDFPQVKFAGMMQYDGELKLPGHFLVPPPSIHQTTGEYLAKNGVSTFACSESQKIGHVTFFWNGNRAAPFDKKLETFHEVQWW